MTIKVYADRIEIGAKTITTTPTGIRIGDSLAANTRIASYFTGASLTAQSVEERSLSFPGENYGFVGGGSTNPLETVSNTIDNFPFAADTNATDVGDLTLARRANLAGCSSKNTGFLAGGFDGSYQNIIDAYLHTSGGGYVRDFGDLTQARLDISGASSRTHGYAFGGTNGTTIDKFAFMYSGNATDVGDLAVGVRSSGGCTSSENGYSIGYQTLTTYIQKFPFATDTNATSVGSLTSNRVAMGGLSSFTDGYSVGGTGTGGAPSGTINTIEKFPFAADTNAVDYADLTTTFTYQINALSSTSHGYTAGGQTVSPSSAGNTIDKFPFASASNATDVGDLTQARGQGGTSQF